MSFSNFQAGVSEWLRACFGLATARDKQERNWRFIEEALELVQSLGCTKEEALHMVEYVYDRPVGEPRQEVGGVMVTLAALCSANNFDMLYAGQDELTRINHPEIMAKIRAKQASKTLRNTHKELP